MINPIPPSRGYIAGPMSRKLLNNWPAFFRAAKDLRGAGWTIENPAETDIIRGYDPTKSPNEQGITYQSLLKEDFEIILTKCDSVIFLPGWKESRGALAECLVAHAAGLVLYEIHYVGKSNEVWRLVKIAPDPQVVV